MSCNIILLGAMKFFVTKKKELCDATDTDNAKKKPSAIQKSRINSGVQSFNYTAKLQTKRDNDFIKKLLVDFYLLVKNCRYKDIVPFDANRVPVQPYKVDGDREVVIYIFLIFQCHRQEVNHCPISNPSISITFNKPNKY